VREQLPVVFWHLFPLFFFSNKKKKIPQDGQASIDTNYT